MPRADYKTARTNPRRVQKKPLERSDSWLWGRWWDFSIQLDARTWGVSCNFWIFGQKRPNRHPGGSGRIQKVYRARTGPELCSRPRIIVPKRSLVGERGCRRLIRPVV